MAKESGNAPNPEKKALPSQQLLAKSEVSLWLDTYDDIFSDFDPRPYDQRALSVDFLDEAKRATREMRQGLQLRFLIPTNVRNTEQEELIKKRLRDHFRKHAVELEKESANILRNGVGFAILGFALLVIASYVSFSQNGESFLFTLLIVVLEPAGWFTAWFGLEELFYKRESKQPEIAFNQKMGQAEILFESY